MSMHNRYNIYMPMHQCLTCNADIQPILKHLVEFSFFKVFPSRVIISQEERGLFRDRVQALFVVWYHAVLRHKQRRNCSLLSSHSSTTTS